MIAFRLLGYLAWEAAVLAASCRLARPIVGPDPDDDGRPSASRFLTATLVLDVLLTCTVATVVSLARAHSTTTYLTIAALTFAALAWSPSRLRDDLVRLGAAIERALRAGSPLDRLIALTLPAVALSACFKPVSGYDSIHLVSYLQPLVSNRIHLQPTPYHYVVFWEMGYLPAMAITKVDALLWVHSLKPVLLAAVVLYRLGAGLGLTRTPALLAAVNAVLVPHFWLSQSGVGTLKNDMAHASGVVLMALGGLKVVRGALDRETGLLLVAGPIFLMVKYSGIPETAAAFGLMALLAGARPWRRPATLARWAGLAAPVWLVTVGHYYIWNLLVFDNPLYPFPFQLGPLVLPGERTIITTPADQLGQTSVLSSLFDPRLRALFFPVDRVSPIGLWFPVTVVAGVAAALAVVVVHASAWVRRRPRDAGPAFVAGCALASWWLYIRSYWSAHALPGDFFYLRGMELQSFRYAEGTLGVTEVFLVYLMTRIRVPAVLTWLVLVSGMTSRLALIYQQSVPGGLETLWTMLPGVAGACLIVLLVAAWRGFGRSRGAMAVAAVVWLLVVHVPAQVETYRGLYWYGFWKEAWQTLDALQARRVYLAYGSPEFTRDHVDLYQYILLRGRFDNQVRGVREEAVVSPGWRGTGYVAYVREPVEGTAASVADFERRAVTVGFERVAGNAYCVLLRRRPARLAGAPIAPEAGGAQRR